MPIPECSRISFIGSASQIRYEGVFAGFDATTKKLKASNLRVCGTEDRLPEEERKPASNLLLKEIEVDVSTICQLHSCECNNVSATVRERYSNSSFHGILVAHIPSTNTMLLSNCTRTGFSTEPMPSFMKVVGGWMRALKSFKIPPRWTPRKWRSYLMVRKPPTSQTKNALCAWNRMMSPTKTFVPVRADTGCVFGAFILCKRMHTLAQPGAQIADNHTPKQDCVS